MLSFHGTAIWLIKSHWFFASVFGILSSDNMKNSIDCHEVVKLIALYLSSVQSISVPVLITDILATEIKSLLALFRGNACFEP